MNEDIYLTCCLCAFLLYHLLGSPGQPLHYENLLNLIIRNVLHSLLAALVTLLGLFLILDIEEAMKNQTSEGEDNLSDTVVYERFTLLPNRTKSKASNDHKVNEAVELDRSGYGGELIGRLNSGRVNSVL
ncbi:hypothetical protein M3Y97_00314800 [Aphelenchoides bicaudatus]|nr:hypothetical protein M3Y97_00314800 [Aphelenchoides bicaudatus]